MGSRTLGVVLYFQQTPSKLCSHVCVSRLSWSPGINLMCTVLDSWSDNQANREQARGLSGSHSFKELFQNRCQKPEVFSDRETQVMVHKNVSTLLRM